MINSNNITEKEFYNILQKEYYKAGEDLLFLLTRTPIITNFGEDKSDYIKFNKYIERNRTKKGIVLNRKLFGIKAKK